MNVRGANWNMRAPASHMYNSNNPKITRRQVLISQRQKTINKPVDGTLSCELIATEIHGGPTTAAVGSQNTKPSAATPCATEHRTRRRRHWGALLKKNMIGHTKTCCLWSQYSQRFLREHGIYGWSSFEETRCSPNSLRALPNVGWCNSRPQAFS